MAAPVIDERLRLAVEENIAWCERVVRAHGGATTTDADRWWAPARTPPFHPDVITRTPDATDVLAGVDGGSGCSVKDSFAALDLSSAGFEVLLEGRWLHRPAGAAGPASEWPSASDVDPVLAALADDPAVRLLDGLVLHDAGAVVGVSNVDGDAEAAWRAAAARCPGRPLVGYESGEALAGARAAGAVDVGPLRVWVRPV